MRPIFTRILVSVLTFAIGVGVVLLLRSITGSTPRRFVPRIGVGIRPESVKENNKGADDLRRVLYDKRAYVESEWSYERLKASGETRAETSRRVLPEVFRGGFLRIHSECSARSTERMAQTEAELAWARAQGQFDPDLGAWLKGNFTETGADETLYEIHVGECNAQSGPLAFGSDQLAIFRGSKLHASINTLLGDVEDDRLFDTDGDGVDEVLLGRTEIKDFSFVTTMRLVSLKGGEPRVIHDFGPAYVITCPDQFCRDTVIITPVITYTPGGAGRPPEFHTDFYRAACRKADGCKFWPRADAWQYFKSGSLDQ